MIWDKLIYKNISDFFFIEISEYFFVNIRSLILSYYKCGPSIRWDPYSDHDDYYRNFLAFQRVKKKKKKKQKL